MGYKDLSRNREYQRDLARLRAERIKQAKEQPCVDCGVEYPFYVMHFDHVSGVKFKSVSRLTTYSWAKIQEEIDKCEIVCANCHASRTHKRAALVERNTRMP